jgi:hypothetical protein
MNAMNLSAIVDAWARMGGVVTDAFQRSVAGAALSLPTIDVPGDEMACSNLQPPIMGGPAPVVMVCGASGQSTVAFSGMTIGAFSAAGVGAATVHGTTVQLPIDIRSIDIRGQYVYTQPCTCWEGLSPHPMNLGCQGAVTQTVGASRLILTCAIAETGGLTLTAAIVTGTVSTQLASDPDLPSGVMDFVANCEPAMASTLSGLGALFFSASFTRSLIDRLTAD